jgi:hypothetical protein
MDASRPLLALGDPDMGKRTKGTPAIPRRMSTPGPERQGERLNPQFRQLTEAFDNERVRLSSGQVGETDPELVVVFDLAGTVKDFRNAVNRIDGLDFLSEFLDDESEPDDDFYLTKEEDRTDDKVQHSLYLVMSNARAVEQLIQLFRQWEANPSITFDRGLGKFKSAFAQLRGIRRWDVADRIRDTGLIDSWREHLEFVGNLASSVLIEIELWYRQDPETRIAAETHLADLIHAAGGVVKDRSQISAIGYHALLAELPIQQVEAVFQEGVESIQLLNTDEIMFVSPYVPMMVTAPLEEPQPIEYRPERNRITGLPRIALLDGLPLVNHDLLAGRLTVDDPDSLGSDYPVLSRNHGTSMASLIIHGDLSDPGPPLERPLYVRPIMQPHTVRPECERVVRDRLLTDLIHCAVKRMIEGENGRDPVAPSVRIVNLSIGCEARAFVRHMSSLGRLLDWLSLNYNLLFIVSAGNHRTAISIPAEAANDLNAARSEVVKAAYATSRQRGILPPGDALNALTVGAIHLDAAGDLQSSDTVWDLVPEGAPAPYGAVGPGVGRSIKPDIYHAGGRALFRRPVVSDGSQNVKMDFAFTATSGPGSKVAAPGRNGASNSAIFTHGTSNATALVSREASRIMDLLETGNDSPDDIPFPDPLFHPVLTKALLVHASSWGNLGAEFRRILSLPAKRARKELTNILGYGTLDVTRLASAATNRAVLVAGGLIGREQEQTFRVPLPTSLSAKAEWHRFTITLAYLAPTVSQLTRYRGARVYFEKLNDAATGGKAIEAEHYANRRGSVQHEVIDGSNSMAITEGDTLPIRVVCMDDAERLRNGMQVRFGLAVSIETSVETSITIHEEIREALRVEARIRTRSRG